MLNGKLTKRCRYSAVIKNSYEMYAVTGGTAKDDTSRPITGREFFDFGGSFSELHLK